MRSKQLYTTLVCSSCVYCVSWLGDMDIRNISHRNELYIYNIQCIAPPPLPRFPPPPPLSTSSIWYAYNISYYLVSFVSLLGFRSAPVMGSTQAKYAEDDPDIIKTMETFHCTYNKQRDKHVGEGGVYVCRMAPFDRIYVIYDICCIVFVFVYVMCTSLECTLLTFVIVTKKMVNKLFDVFLKGDATVWNKTSKKMECEEERQRACSMYVLTFRSFPLMSNMSATSESNCIHHPFLPYLRITYLYIFRRYVRSRQLIEMTEWRMCNVLDSAICMFDLIHFVLIWYVFLYVFSGDGQLNAAEFHLVFKETDSAFLSRLFQMQGNKRVGSSRTAPSLYCVAFHIVHALRCSCSCFMFHVCVFLFVSCSDINHDSVLAFPEFLTLIATFSCYDEEEMTKCKQKQKHRNRKKETDTRKQRGKGTGYGRLGGWDYYSDGTDEHSYAYSYSYYVTYWLMSLNFLYPSCFFYLRFRWKWYHWNGQSHQSGKCKPVSVHWRRCLSSIMWLYMCDGW